MNPGGSVKDRAAKWIVLDAERRGVQAKRYGRRGHGRQHRHRARACVQRARLQVRHRHAGQSGPGEISNHRGPRRASCARCPRCPTATRTSIRKVAGRLAAELPDAIWANQFDNTANRLAHFESTGPEIWNDTGGKDRRILRRDRHGRHAGRRGRLSQVEVPRGSHRAGRSAGQRALSLCEGRRAALRRRLIDHRGHRHRPRHRQSRRSADRRRDAHLRCRDGAFRLSPAARGRLAARKHGGHQRRGGGADRQASGPGTPSSPCCATAAPSISRGCSTRRGSRSAASRRRSRSPAEARLRPGSEALTRFERGPRRAAVEPGERRHAAPPPRRRSAAPAIAALRRAAASRMVAERCGERLAARASCPGR